MGRRTLAYGDRSVLVELDTLEEVLPLYRALRATRPAGVVDIIPAARTIVVLRDPHTLESEAMTEWVAACAHDGQVRSAEAVADTVESDVVIDVEYSGADLAVVAAHLGVDEREVIGLHTRSRWRVAFTGFAPGFGYLVTDHRRLEVPRREIPRKSVPAGAVGLAGEFSGVYPRSSPGGWQLIGITAATLWDSAATPPAVLVPGRTVRFQEV